MEVVYTGEEPPYKFTKSIFLAGPSRRPNQDDFESWRKDALDILKDSGFDGVVFCPEVRNFTFEDKHFVYEKQIEWEDKYLHMSDCILFWVPRDLSIDKNKNIKLPAFTTNIEWGTWCSSGKVVFGAPEGAEKNEYMKHYADKYNVPIGNNLSETIANALDFLEAGAERVLGERYIPLFIWNTPNFQSWYKSQIAAGNRLEDAKLLFNFRPRYSQFVFLWILKVNIFIGSEQRFKTNEFVLSRPDISSIVLHYQKDNFLNSEIVLIKEFRSSANTKDGFIRELPSCSTVKNKDNKEIAAEELLEETGFHVMPDKLKFVNSAQLMGTLSSHKSHLYYLELGEDEIKYFKSQKNIAHGNIKDSEKTFIEVYTVQQLLSKEVEVDWSTMGQILFALSTNE